MTIGLVIATIGACIIIEGLFLTLFPNTVKIVLSSMVKKSEKIKKAGLTELLIGIIVLVIGIILISI